MYCTSRYFKLAIAITVTELRFFLIKMSLNTISVKKLPKICFMMCIKGELFKNFHKLSLAVSIANLKLIYRKGHLLSKGGGESVDFPPSLPPSHLGYAPVHHHDFFTSQTFYTFCYSKLSLY